MRQSQTADQPTAPDWLAAIHYALYMYKLLMMLVRYPEWNNKFEFEFDLYIKVSQDGP